MLSSESVQRSPVDQWNNVKVLYFREDAYQSKTDRDGWLRTDSVANRTWASFSGLIPGNVPGDAKATFPVETSYIDAVCQDAVVKSYVPDSQQLSDVLTTLGFEAGNALDNLSQPFSFGGTVQETASFFTQTYSSPMAFRENATQPVTLAFVSIRAGLWKDLVPTGPDKVNLTVYNCTISDPKVEGIVDYDGRACRMTQVRRTRKEIFLTLVPPFSWSQYVRLLTFLPGSIGYPVGVTGGLAIGGISALELYMSGSKNFLGDQTAPPLDTWSGVSGRGFGQRLTTLVNTVWQIAQAPSGVGQGASANFSSDHVPSAETTATVTRSSRRYTADRKFVALLLVITIILHVCAIAGLILQYVTKAPDVLGYVSTMTRDNPYTHVPPGGNTLDGLERARNLATLRVQLADVMPKHDVGHIVLRSTDHHGSEKLAELNKKRVYI